MAIAFNYAARSDVGLVRSENQDSGYAGPHLLAVADGMGGHAGGDVASSVAIGELVALDGESIAGPEATAYLQRGIARANTEISQQSSTNPELQGMGTTVTALLRAQNKIVIAHIGDSRAYLLRDGSFDQITHDHSFVQTLIDTGRITEEQAEMHPQRSLVTRVLTGQPADEPDLAVREAVAGDRFLICSDGLSGFVARDTIRHVLASDQGPGATADRLVELALKSGAPDNVTVIVADVIDLTTAAAPSTDAQIVGAAALRRQRTRPIPVTPAAKAAELSRQVSGNGARAEEATAHEEAVALAEEGPRTRTTRAFRGLAATVIALIVLAGGGYAVWNWSQSQFYVGQQDGKITIFQGVSQDLGPISLSHAASVSTVDVGDLPDFYRNKIVNTVSVQSRREADALVESMRAEAVQCARLKAADQPCGAEPAGSTSTTSPTSTGAPT